MMVFAMAAFGARHGSAEPILIFAASSLSGALDAVVTDYQKTRPADVRLSYSASSTLARQLTRGAPAKIFISANESWIKFAEHQQALQASSKFVLARNRLVLAAPKGKVTGFTNQEEDAVGLTDIVPFLLEDVLIEQGGTFSKQGVFEPYVVQDGLLITGQNPPSSEPAAEKLLEALKAD